MCIGIHSVSDVSVRGLITSLMFSNTETKTATRGLLGDARLALLVLPTLAKEHYTLTIIL